MNDIAVLDSVDADHWNQRIESLGGPMQLTTEWASFVCAKDRLRPLFMAKDESGDFIVAIAYLSSSKTWPVSRWPSASADCIPLASDRRDALACLERILRKRGACRLQLNSFAYDGVSPIQLAPLGFTPSERFEFMLSLDDGIDGAWRHTRPTLRNDIRRFERSEATCRIRTDHALVGDLYSIEQETASRHRLQGKTGNPMRASTYELLWENLVQPGRVHVYIAESDGLPIASAVIGCCGAKAYYLYGGATLLGLSLNAPKGLLWFAIQNEYEQGVREFNLGGMAASAAQPDSVDHGLYKFKSGFGASERTCISGYKVFRPGLVRLQASLRGTVQRVRDRLA